MSACPFSLVEVTVPFHPSFTNPLRNVCKRLYLWSLWMKSPGGEGVKSYGMAIKLKAA